MPLQSMELCQNQKSPQKDVAAPNPDTAQHISFLAGGYSNQDLPWAWQPHCLDSSGSESSFTDEEQQMHKMLCCPITKVTGQLHCSCPCLFQGAMCLKIIFQSLPFCCKYGTIVHDVVLQACCTDICGSCLQITFVDPVIAADGHTYERTAMEHWMQHKTMSPVTGDLLSHCRLVPNMVIKSMVAAQSC